MHTKNVRMRPVPLWGRCTGSTDFTSRKKNTRKTNGATKQHSMRDQRQLWKSFSSSFASFEFTSFFLHFLRPHRLSASFRSSVDAPSPPFPLVFQMSTIASNNSQMSNDKS